MNDWTCNIVALRISDENHNKQCDSFKCLCFRTHLVPVLILSFQKVLYFNTTAYQRDFEINLLKKMRFLSFKSRTFSRKNPSEIMRLIWKMSEFQMAKRFRLLKLRDFQVFFSRKRLRLISKVF